FVNPVPITTCAASVAFRRRKGAANLFPEHPIGERSIAVLFAPGTVRAVDIGGFFLRARTGPAVVGGKDSGWSRLLAVLQQLLDAQRWFRESPALPQVVQSG